MKILLLLLLLLSPALAQRWPIEIERTLSSEAVESVKPLSEAIENFDGSNPYLLLTLADGTKGVFRSEDDPWGSEAELAGYRLTTHLGLDLVPPVVPRTLTRSELGEAWPWESSERPGTLQLFVEGAKPADPSELSTEDLANSEILSFVTGRYDNHSGNLLVDPKGRAVLIDFEGSLDFQMVRYGDFPFIRRGFKASSPWNVEASQPFPFDTPRTLVDPSLEEIQSTFGPWWGQVWPQGMVGLHRLLRGIPERTVPYVIWDDQLWVQVRVRSRHPIKTDHYPTNTLEGLAKLDLAQVENLFPAPYRRRHHRALLTRTKQILKESRSKPKRPN